MTLPNKRFGVMLLGIVLLLCIPLIAMQYAPEVDWKLSDFAIMAALLLSVALTCEWILRTVKRRLYRIIICGTGILVFLLTWAELAVGIFGTAVAGS